MTTDRMYETRTLVEATDEQLHAGVLTGETQFVRLIPHYAVLDGEFSASELRILARKLDGKKARQVGGQ